MLDNHSFSKHTSAWSDCDLSLWNNLQDAFYYLSSRCDTETRLPFALVYAPWNTDKTNQPNHFVLTIHSSHAWMGRLLSTCYFSRFGAKNNPNTQEKQVVISETLIASSQWAYSQTSEAFHDCLNLWFGDGRDEVCWSLPCDIHLVSVRVVWKYSTFYTR